MLLECLRGKFMGYKVEVKVTEIDEKGRVNLSRKELLPKPEKKDKKEDNK